MPRIFASLAIAILTLFALTAAVALIDSGSAPDRHVLLAVASLLLSCFIQALGFTYLTVTGKVIAQAVHFASLDPACLASVKQYKRTFARQLALVAIGTILASATGGAALRSPDELAVHVPAAIIAAIIHVWVYGRQFHILRRNAHLVESTLEAYASWRTQQISHNVPIAASPESTALAP